MKILQVVSGYPPMLGGVENSVYELVTRLRFLGYDVKVITAGVHSQGIEEDVWRLPVFFKLERNWGDLLFCPSIVKALKNIQFDIVHAHTPRKLFAEAVAFYKLLSARKFPYIVSVRLLNKSLQGFWRGSAQVYQKVIEKHVLRHAEYVIVQNKENQKVMNKTFRIPLNKIYIVPNGVDVEFFNPKRFSKDETKEKLIIGDEGIVLFAGRLTTQKGLQYLFNAIPKIKKIIPGVKFLIVGEGPLKHYLQDQSRKLNISKDIVFLGEVPHSDIATFYSVADVFVLPSLSESFPNVLLEAMSMKKAIVVTRVGAVPEVATDNENAILIEPGSTDQIAKAITTLLSNNSLRKKLGVNARKLVKQKYTWDSVVKKTLQIYEKALA